MSEIENEKIRSYCENKPELLLTIGICEGDKEKIQSFSKLAEYGCDALYEIGSITKVLDPYLQRLSWIKRLLWRILFFSMQQLHISNFLRILQV